RARGPHLGARAVLPAGSSLACSAGTTCPYRNRPPGPLRPGRGLRGSAIPPLPGGVPATGSSLHPVPPAIRSRWQDLASFVCARPLPPDERGRLGPAWPVWPRPAPLYATSLPNYFSRTPPSEPVAETPPGSRPRHRGGRPPGGATSAIPSTRVGQRYG